MATFYIDFVNGNDANAGTSWGLAWKTVNTGATAARIAPGDIIRMAKSPDKISLGNGTWTSVTSATTATDKLSVSAATNATPIAITTTANHGLSTGDVVQINSVGGNTAANGTWIVTSTGLTTFTLDGSAGNGAYTTGGLVQNINFRCVKLASNTVTKLVSDVNLGWVNANSSTVTADTTYVKTPGQALTIQAPSSAAANTRYAYFTLPASTDFSAFTDITLWVRSGTATMTGNTWKICLCSDTLGVTVVDEFLIPALTATNVPNSLVLTKSGGGNLGAAIQSVAVYSGSTQINSSVITIDNINACTATGLNLQSMISPSSSNTELYENYPIAGILDTIILLDNDTPRTSLIPATAITNNALRGFSGTGGTVTTYHRNPVDYAKVNSIAYSNIVSVCTANEAGTRGNVTTYSGGWNTATDTQEGLTILYIPAASAGWTPSDFNKIEYCGISRGSRGFGFAGVGRVFSGFTIENCFSSGSTQAINFAAQSVLSVATYPNTITNFGATNSGTTGFLALNQPLVVNNFKAYNASALGSGSTIIAGFQAQGSGSIFKNIEVTNCNQICYIVQGNSTFVNCTGKYSPTFYASEVGGGYWYNTTSANNTNTFASVWNGNGGDTYFEKITNSTDGSTYSSALNQYSYNTMYLKDINGTTADWASYSYFANVSRETSITHSGNSSWKVQIQNAYRDSTFPYTMKMAEVYCKANVSTTISIWMYITNSSMAANLSVPGRQIAGVDNDVTTAANSATVNSWQQVSVNFTPTASGVVKVFANVWSTGAANQSVYLDDLSFPGGVGTANLDYSLMGAPWSFNTATNSYAAVGL